MGWENGNPHGAAGGVRVKRNPFLPTLLEVSAAVAGGDVLRLRGALERALNESGEEGEHLGAVEEVLVQSYLFLGYPAALNALAIWREVSGVVPGPPTEDDPGEWEARGEATCRAVYGDRYPGLRRNIAALHPDLDRWMVREGYGKVLARPGVELRDRELCIVAVLAVLGAPIQLHSHLRGALLTGASHAEVEMALGIAGEVVRGREMDEAYGVWEEVRSTRSGREK